MMRNSPRVAAVLTGATIGGLIWSALNDLGFWGALKSDLLIGPLAVAILLGGIAGSIPLLRRALFIVAVLAVLLLVIVSYTPLATALTRPMVRADPTRGEKLDAIVVLSGGVTADSTMSTQTLDRLLKGAEEVRAGHAHQLILSRETFHSHWVWLTDSLDEAAVLSQIGLTVPVFFIDSATSTHDEALRVKRLEGAAAWNRIGLVTSPLHTRRACATFESVGFRVTCIPSASRERAIKNLNSPGDRLRAFQQWFYEAAGTMNYRLKGWI